MPTLSPRFHPLLAIALSAVLLSACHRLTPIPNPPPQVLLPPPPFAESIIASSIQGRPIRMVRFGNAAPVVLILAGIHGDEFSGCYVAEQLMAELAAFPPADEEASVVILSQVNPDGCAAHKRGNANGVDLNRNFPAANWKQTRRGASYSGPAPQSEPETAALIRLVEDLRPQQIISIHCIRGGRQCNNYDGPAQPLAEAMSCLNHYPAKAAIGYPTPGSLGSWAGIDRQIPVITLELPASLSPAQTWLANREALLLAITSAGECAN